MSKHTHTTSLITVLRVVFENLNIGYNGLFPDYDHSILPSLTVFINKYQCYLKVSAKIVTLLKSMKSLYFKYL